MKENRNKKYSRVLCDAKLWRIVGIIAAAIVYLFVLAHWCIGIYIRFSPLNSSTDRIVMHTYDRQCNVNQHMLRRIHLYEEKKLN